MSGVDRCIEYCRWRRDEYLRTRVRELKRFVGVYMKVWRYRCVSRVDKRRMVRNIRARIDLLASAWGTLRADIRTSHEIYRWCLEDLCGVSVGG